MKRLSLNKGDPQYNKETLERLVEGWKVSSQADLSRPWISSGTTLSSSGHQTREMARSCMAERKGFSSQANLFVSIRCLCVKV
jgi:hypothetical protein